MPSSHDKLIDLAERYGLGPVSYDHTALQSGKFIATVRVGRRTFPCYPLEFDSSSLAKDECARQALEYYQKWLREQSLGQTRVQLPETTDIALMTKRILDIVRPHSSGCWGPAVVVKYSRVHGERLPDNWIKLVQQVSQEIEFSHAAGDHFLVQCRATSTEQEKKPVAGASAVQSAPGRHRRPLPDTWLVHILAVLAGDRVAVRRIDTKEYEEWEKMAADMDSFYRNPKGAVMKPVSRVEPGLLYAALIDACWLRVELIDYLEDGTVAVSLVDFADKEKVSVDKVFPLQGRFAFVPPQGVDLQLEGLAHMAASKPAIQILIDRLLNKVLVARINQPAHDGRGSLSAVLYESTEGGERDMNKWITVKAEEKASKML